MGLLITIWPLEWDLKTCPQFILLVLNGIGRCSPKFQRETSSRHLGCFNKLVNCSGRNRLLAEYFVTVFLGRFVSNY